MLTSEYVEYLAKCMMESIDGTYEATVVNWYIRKKYMLAKTNKGKKVYYRRYKGRN